MIKIINCLLSAVLAVCAACLSGRLPGDRRHGGLRAAGLGIRVLMPALYLDRISELIIAGIIAEGISKEGIIIEGITIKEIISCDGGMDPGKTGGNPLFFLAFLLSKGILMGFFLARKYLLKRERQPDGDTEESKILHLQVEGLLTGAAVFFMGMLFLERGDSLYLQLARVFACICAYGLLYGTLRYYETYAAEKERLRQNRQQAQSEERYARSLENNYQRMRELWHDMKNHIGMLTHFVKEGDCERAEEYLRVFGEEVDAIVLPVKSGNLYLDTVLADKFSAARRAGIRMQLEIGRLSQMPLRPDEIGSVFGNLLDNAIEACERLEGERWIWLRIWEKEEEILLSIQNPTIIREADSDIRKSNKKDRDNLVGHGIGLRSVERILHSHGGELALSVKGSADGSCGGESRAGNGVAGGSHKAADGVGQFTVAVRLPKDGGRYR